MDHLCPAPAQTALGYTSAAYVLVLALMIAGARVTEADARLVELVLDGVRTLGTYLTG